MIERWTTTRVRAGVKPWPEPQPADGASRRPVCANAEARGLKVSVSCCKLDCKLWQQTAVVVGHQCKSVSLHSAHVTGTNIFQRSSGQIPNDDNGSSHQHVCCSASPAAVQRTMHTHPGHALLCEAPNGKVRTIKGSALRATDSLLPPPQALGVHVQLRACAY